MNDEGYRDPTADKAIQQTRSRNYSPAGCTDAGHPAARYQAIGKQTERSFVLMNIDDKKEFIEQNKE